MKSTAKQKEQWWETERAPHAAPRLIRRGGLSKLPTSPMLSVKVAAERVTMNPQYIRDAIHKGDLDAQWLGCWRFTEEAFISFLNERNARKLR